MPEYRQKNFSQQEPNTPIHADEVGNLYVQCNLLNCRVPEDATVERCQVGQHVRWTEETTVETDGETATVTEDKHQFVGVGVKGEVSQAQIDVVIAALGLEPA